MVTHKGLIVYMEQKRCTWCARILNVPYSVLLAELTTILIWSRL